MRFAITSLLALAACTIAQAKVWPLSEKLFDSMVSEPGDLMVVFHSPKDEASRALVSEIELTANAAEEQGLNVKFAKVNAEKYQALVQKYGVSRLPSMRYFKEGEAKAVGADDIGITHEEILHWVRNAHLAADRVMELTTKKDVKKFISNMTKSGNTVGVLGLFKNETGVDAFKFLTSEFKYPVKFGYTTLPEAWALANASVPMEEAHNMLILYKPYDERRMEKVIGELTHTISHTREGVADLLNKMMGVPADKAIGLMPEPKEVQPLREWIEMMMSPVVVPFAHGFESLIFDGPVKVHVILVAEDEISDEIQEAFQQVAIDRRGEALHIVLYKREHTEPMIDYFGLKNAELPTVLISDMRETSSSNIAGAQYFWKKRGAITQSNLEHFEEDFFNDKLEPDLGELTQKQKNRRKSAKKSSKKASASGSSEL